MQENTNKFEVSTHNSTLVLILCEVDEKNNVSKLVDEFHFQSLRGWVWNIGRKYPIIFPPRHNFIDAQDYEEDLHLSRLNFNEVIVDTYNHFFADESDIIMMPLNPKKKAKWINLDHNFKNLS